jgi:ABC-type multidrug transport system fused ATPase/permease subunit
MLLLLLLLLLVVVVVVVLLYSNRQALQVEQAHLWLHFWEKMTMIEVVLSMGEKEEEEEEKEEASSVLT